MVVDLQVIPVAVAEVVGPAVQVDITTKAAGSLALAVVPSSRQVQLLHL